MSELQKAIKCCLSGSCRGCPRQNKKYPAGRKDCRDLLYDHIKVALSRPEPKAIIPNKRIPGIGRCPTCKQDLCMDDEKLHYCPTCGTHLVTPSQLV